MTVILLGVAMFTGVILALVVVLLLARRKLVASGEVTIVINDDAAKALKVAAGGTLLGALAANKIFIPSACGGKGACGVCEVIVQRGRRRPAADRDRLHLAAARPSAAAAGLPGQGQARHEDRGPARGLQRAQVEVPRGLQPQRGHLHQGTEAGAARGRGSAVPRRRLRADRMPAARRSTSRLRHRAAVPRRLGQVRPVALQVDGPTTRSRAPTRWPTTRSRRASCCSRSASPSRPATSEDIPPGIMSSWVFNLKPGDEVTVSGPFGEFFARDTDAEMCFIGGGAGMAPMRSHIFDQFLPPEHDSARSPSGTARAACARRSTSRSSTKLAGREPELPVAPGAVRAAARGQLGRAPPASSTRCCYDSYLKNHPAPEDIEYYMCGPGPMTKAVIDDAARPGRRAREHHARRLRLSERHAEHRTS